MKNIYFLLISILSVACASSVHLPKDISTEGSILLPFKVDTVIIVDLRKDTISTELTLPIFAVKQREWIVRPSLKADLQQDIMDLIKKGSYSDGIPAVVTVSIHDGYYRIAGNAKKVGEYTEFDCVVNFAPKELRQQWNSSAKSYNNYEGLINATEKHAKQMYRITAINGVYTALKQAEKMFDTGDAKNHN